jgi:hypothetical protein
MAESESVGQPMLNRSHRSRPRDASPPPTVKLKKDGTPRKPSGRPKRSVDPSKWKTAVTPTFGPCRRRTKNTERGKFSERGLWTKEGSNCLTKVQLEEFAAANGLKNGVGEAFSASALKKMSKQVLMEL